MRDLRPLANSMLLSQGTQCLRKIVPENKWTRKYKYISVHILGGSKCLQIAVHVYIL